jgi:hypothetical protein
MLSARTYQLVIVDEQAGDFSAPFWECVIETAEQNGEEWPTRFYVIGGQALRAGLRCAAERLPRPIKALDLVRAAERAA